jgi:tetratricopeptide (TPR) repeat protein
VQLTGEKLPLKPGGKRSNPWRVLFYIVLIGSGILVTRLVEAGRVKPLLVPTPFPTRTANSYVDEGRAYFSAGDLNQAIASYEIAVQYDPGNGRYLAELARIQTYSSELTTNYQDRRARLDGAIASIDQAVALSPDDSFIHAIRALVYDWAAAAQESMSDRNKYLNQAETSAVRANQLDPEHPLTLAYYAEVLTDQQKWAQALDLAEKAVARAEEQPDALGDTQMDVYRVHATVLENIGLYRQAIDEYEKAAAITPNLTFLYLRIGTNYRQLGANNPIQSQRDQYFDLALEYFNRAAQINEQLTTDPSKQDPVPYIAIGKTYLQQGEFFVAALNMARALAINPSDPAMYGQLGIVYYKARNYESAIPVLQCAVEGCSADESQSILCELGYADCESDAVQGAFMGQDVDGLPLASGSVEYYYTYAAALAYYSGTEVAPSGCRDAERIHEELLRVYGNDTIVRDIVEENRNICSGVTSSEDLEPTATIEPES